MKTKTFPITTTNTGYADLNFSTSNYVIVSAVVSNQYACIPWKHNSTWSVLIIDFSTASLSPVYVPNKALSVTVRYYEL